MSVKLDMKVFATGLQQSIQETEEALKKMKDTLKMVQSLCAHPSWEDTGHDSHYNYHICTECGFEDNY